MYKKHLQLTMHLSGLQVKFRHKVKVCLRSKEMIVQLHHDQRARPLALVPNQKKRWASKQLDALHSTSGPKTQWEISK